MQICKKKRMAFYIELKNEEATWELEDAMWEAYPQLF
jgi:hypothetical protein